MSYSTHLASGLRILGERWFDGPRKWITAGENAFDKAVRMALVGGIGYGLWRVVSSSWKLLGVTVLVVVVMALRAATKAAKSPPKKAFEAPAKQAADEQHTPPVDGLPAVGRYAFHALLYDTLGVATGVHLRTLAAALTTRHGGAWDVPAVRALCTAYEVPVRPTVRAPGGGPTVGVHRDDLPPLPDHSPTAPTGPVVGVVAAGQSATTPPTTGAATDPSTTPTTPTVSVHGDLRIVAHDDPDNPARTHVTVVEPRRKRTG